METEQEHDESPVSPVSGAAVAPAVSAAGPVKTAEEWALAKGMLPEKLPGKPRRDKPQLAPRPVPNPQHRKFREASFIATWPIGKELIEADFDKAVTDAATHVYR